jgi:hypothetical protein
MFRKHEDLVTAACEIAQQRSGRFEVLGVDVEQPVLKDNGQTYAFPRVRGHNGQTYAQVDLVARPRAQLMVDDFITSAVADQYGTFLGDRDLVQFARRKTPEQIGSFAQDGRPASCRFQQADFPFHLGDGGRQLSASFRVADLLLDSLQFAPLGVQQIVPAIPIVVDPELLQPFSRLTQYVLNRIDIRMDIIAASPKPPNLRIQNGNDLFVQRGNILGGWGRIDVVRVSDASTKTGVRRFDEDLSNVVSLGELGHQPSSTKRQSLNCPP